MTRRIDDETFVSHFQRVMGRIFQASMHNFWRQLKAQGLTLPQMFALRYIYYKGPCHITDIARELGVTSAAVSQMLNRLVDQGLIVRQEAAHDRRHKQLTLTDKGRAVLEENARAQVRWLQDVAARLSDEERAKVIEAMEILEEKVSNEQR